jgi:hypothetical protein
MRTVKRTRLSALALATIVTELSGFPEQARGLPTNYIDEVRDTKINFVEHLR